MELRTTFHGGDILFEGDLPLLLRALPAGATVTHATLTVAPAQGTDQSERFHESFDLTSGTAEFGVVVQPGNGNAIVDLGARRTITELELAGLSSGNALPHNIAVQLDLGGIWLQLDQNGNPAQPNTNPTFPVTATTLALPNLVAQRLRLAEQTANPNASFSASRVDLLTYPANLTLRVGNLGPFWFRNGDLRVAVTTPDFADILQGFLDRSQPVEGIFEVPFILHSDSLARLRLTLNVDYYVKESLLPSELSQVVLPFQYGALPTAPPVQIAAVLPLDARVLPGATSAQVVGRFDASRVVHGPVSATAVQATIRVSPEQSCAHPILLSSNQTATAIDLHLEAITASAKLLITLQEDVGLKPWGPSLLPEPIQLILERSAAGGSRWASAPLPADFTFQADRVYWLIVNAAEGEVNWAVEAAGTRPPLQATRDAGLSWRAAQLEGMTDKVVGLYRLRAPLPRFRQPIKLDVAGHTVMLNSFDGLGKVDFRLDIPAFADALNAALDDVALQQINRTERIANGDFGRWTRMTRGRPRLAGPPFLLGGAPSRALAVDPRATHVYAAVHPFQTSSFVQAVMNEHQPRLNTALNLTQGTSADRILSLAVSTDSQYVYAAVQRVGPTGAANQLEIHKISMEDEEPITIRQVASTQSFDPSVQLAFDPRCQYVYLSMHQLEAESAVLFRLDADTLEFTLADEGPSDRLRLDTLREPQSLNLDPDGRRAYIGTEGGMFIVDLERWEVVGDAWFADEGAPDLAGLTLSCDGKRLYAVSTRSTQEMYVSELTLLILDAALLNKIVDRTRPFEQAIMARVGLGRVSEVSSSRWTSLAAAPDDTRLLIGHESVAVLQVVDITSCALLEPIRLPAAPLSLAITPDSRRAFVLAEQGDDSRPLFGFQLHVVELDNWIADHWALTAGRVAPSCAAGSAMPTARLGAPFEQAGLSQIFAVEGGQDYTLTFMARSSAPGAIAELFWLSHECGLLDSLSVDIQTAHCRPDLLQHTLHCAAPPAADRAELRFTQPAGSYTLLDNVGMGMATVGIVNGDFTNLTPTPLVDPVTGEPVIDADTNMPVIVERPHGWQVVPQSVANVVQPRPAPDGGVRLTGQTNMPTGPRLQSAVLSQMLPITASQSFTISVTAFPYGRSTKPPTIELHWSDSSSPPLRYELSAQRFDVTTLSGTVPADATGATLVFTQPPGGQLDIVRVEWSQAAAVSVPIHFLSEAPGELTVITPVVAYDRDAERHSRRSLAQPQPLLGCKPTPPDTLPGQSDEAVQEEPDDPDMIVKPGFCPCCETIHAVEHPAVVISESGMAAVAGRCPHCNADVVMFPSR